MLDLINSDKEPIATVGANIDKDSLLLGIIIGIYLTVIIGYVIQKIIKYAKKHKTNHNKE